jgi:hypothetical protein
MLLIVILLLVLYGCETWSATLSEEHRPRAFENGVLRRELLSSFLGSTAQLRPWPHPQNPAEFFGGFSTIFFTV